MEQKAFLYLRGERSFSNVDAEPWKGTRRETLQVRIRITTQSLSNLGVYYHLGIESGYKQKSLDTKRGTSMTSYK